MRGPEQRWYRGDVLRRCKTGEVIEATPRSLAEKLRIVALGLLTGVPLIVASQWFLKVWTPRYYAGLDALAKTDPVASARKLAEFTSLLLLVPVLLGVGVAIGSVVAASRVVRAGRYPLPGAKVFRRTEVVGGWCARAWAVLLAALLLACMLVAWWSYVRVVAMFWDGYLGKIAVPVHANRSHPAGSARVFDIMMRPHHDADGLGRKFPRVPMRTTIDIPEREHALFTSLARAQHTSLSKLLLDLARRGLEAPEHVAETAASYRIDPETGLAVFRSGRPVTIDDVKALEDEDDARAYGAS